MVPLRKKVAFNLVNRGLERYALSRDHTPRMNFPILGLHHVAMAIAESMVDEPVGQFGRALKLPPWEKAKCAEIEGALPPVRY